MTGQGARDDQRALVAIRWLDYWAQNATDPATRTDCALASDVIRDLAASKHSVPETPARVALSVHSRRSGKTQQMINALLAQADERGIAVEVIESKHPEPGITDEMVERAAYGMYRVRPLNLDQDGGDDWGILPESWRQEWRDAARAALTAALRVPVGEGER